MRVTGFSLRYLWITRKTSRRFAKFVTDWKIFPPQFHSKAAATSRYSPAVLEHLNELNRKRAKEKTGSVTIEELGQVADGTDAVN